MCFAGFAGEDESWNPWGEEFVKEGQREPPHFVKPKLVLRGKDAENVVDTADTRWQDQSPNTTAEYSVEIWGKAAIGISLHTSAISNLYSETCKCCQITIAK